MPCKDTTSMMTVNLDHDNRLIEFQFNKVTCSKEIGEGVEYRDLCEGKSAQEVLDLEFSDVLQRLNLVDTEVQFLVYLQWDALRSALLQYLGKEDLVDSERYQIASVEFDEKGVCIRQVIRPPQDMPKIQSCFSRARKALN